jgi:hypothetical protein
MNIKRVGIDLAKQVFQVHGVDGQEKAVLRQTRKAGSSSKPPHQQRSRLQHRAQRARLQ